MSTGKCPSTYVYHPDKGIEFRPKPDTQKVVATNIELTMTSDEHTLSLTVKEKNDFLTGHLGPSQNNRYAFYKILNRCVHIRKPHFFSSSKLKVNLPEK